MQIIIENCSSPGAHFSDNTNVVLMKIHKWINDNNKPTLMFIDFRKRLKHDEGINDNNARNIYPLLKNCGFADYTPGDVLDTSCFFTPTGIAYVTGLESLKLIEQGEYTKEQKRKAAENMERVLQQLIYDGVARLLRNTQLNYSEGMKWFIMFLLEHGKIDRNEFAYMVYQMSRDENNWQEKIRPVIEGYRNKEFAIDVKVRVRNDQGIQKRTGRTTRLEGISFFTAYTYYAALFWQAGLTTKSGGYYYLKSDAKKKAKILLED